MSGPDSTQFSGPGAIFALILAHVVYDYKTAPEDSLAFQTAEMFIEGKSCQHDGEKYDWSEWRDMIVGALGIEVAGFVAAVKAGRKNA